MLLVVVLVTGLVCLIVMLGERRKALTPLLALLAAAGFAQGILISVTRDLAWQIADDVVTIAVIGAAFAARPKSRAWLFVLVAGLLSVLAARGAGAEVGVEQARQVMLPIGLAAAGFAARKDIGWQSLFRVVVVLGVATALWMMAEEVAQAPLLDATWYYLNAQGGTDALLRNGLPPSYVADGIGVLPSFRPGGPYLNPPIAGFALGAAAAGAVMQAERGRWHWLVLTLLALALAFSYARAGVVIFLAVTGGYWAWTRLGRFVGAAFAILVAAYGYVTFVRQGNTGSHVEGLADGFVGAFRNPLGEGFGVSGFQVFIATGQTGSGSESLLGLYAVWLGLPVVLVVAWAVARLAKNAVAAGTSAYALFPIAGSAFLLAAASSETASAIASTPSLWVLLGAALARGSSRPERGSGQVDRRRRPSSAPIRSSGKSVVLPPRPSERLPVGVPDRGEPERRRVPGERLAASVPAAGRRGQGTAPGVAGIRWESPNVASSANQYRPRHRHGLGR